MKKPSRKLRNERGQTLTEFAMVLPLLFVLLFGIIQFGIVFNNYVTLTDAARAGARKGAVSRGSGNPTADCVNQVRAAAPNLKPADLTVSCSSSWTSGSDVTVTATYPYSISLMGWVVASGRLNSTMKERVE